MNGHSSRPLIRRRRHRPICSAICQMGKEPHQWRWRGDGKRTDRRSETVVCRIVRRTTNIKRTPSLAAAAAAGRGRPSNASCLDRCSADGGWQSWYSPPSEVLRRRDSPSIFPIRESARTPAGSTDKKDSMTRHHRQIYWKASSTNVGRQPSSFLFADAAAYHGLLADIPTNPLRGERDNAKSILI